MVLLLLLLFLLVYVFLFAFLFNLMFAPTILRPPSSSPVPHHGTGRVSRSLGEG